MSRSQTAAARRKSARALAAGRRVLLAERRKGTTELEAEVRAIQAALAAMRLSRRGRLLALARAAAAFPPSTRKKKSREHTIDELEPIIRKFVATPNPDEAAKLEKQILEGYYGRPIADLAGC